jgi:hypothetical protein
VAAASVPQLVDAQAAARESLTAATAAAIGEAVRRFTGWYDTAAITVFAKAVAARVESSQRAMSSMTDAYLARVASAIRGVPVRPVGAIGVDGLRQGIAHDAVYGRLADQYRYLRSKGLGDQQVLDRVVERAAVMVGTDMDLAMQHQSRAFMLARHATGYRRVIHPELSAGGTCGLCAVASHRVYHVADLMPIHARCKCVPTPIYGSDDPGSVINTEDLKTMYAAAGSTGAADLKRTRYTVHQHAELGPQLRAEKDHWRSPAQVRADRAAADH